MLDTLPGLIRGPRLPFAMMLFLCSCGRVLVFPLSPLLTEALLNLLFSFFHAKMQMAALAPAQRERKRLQRTAECLKDGFVWDGPKMPKTPKCVALKLFQDCLMMLLGALRDDVRSCAMRAHI